MPGVYGCQRGITAGAVDGNRGMGAGGGGVGGVRGVTKDLSGRDEGEAGEPFGGYEEEGTWKEVE